MKCDAKRLEEIEARAKAAFIGPWTHGTFTVECDSEDPRCPEGDDCEGEREATRIEAPEEYPDGQVVCDVYGLETFAGPNAAFIAHARTDVGDLLADLREARAALERIAAIGEVPGAYGDARDEARQALGLCPQCARPTPEHAEWCRESAADPVGCRTSTTNA